MNPISKPIKRKELLALPHRKWNEEKIYDCLYIVPTGKKHDSGYSLIAIVGVLYQKEPPGAFGEICAWVR